RYINHACRPNAESDVQSRNRKVFIRAIKNIQPGEEINYDYGKDYFKEYLKPIGCKCDSCEKKRKLARAEERAAKKRAEKRAGTGVAKARANGNGAAHLNGKTAPKTASKAGRKTATAKRPSSKRGAKRN